MKRIKPPLPFSGHKGMWVNELTEIAKKLAPGTTVFDCFGGSGVCAHIVKNANQSLRVVLNDYDDYIGRFKSFPQLEQLRRQCLAICGSDSHRLTEDERAAILNVFEQSAAEHGSIPEAAWRWFFLASMKTATTLRPGYARVRTTPYDREQKQSETWCKGVEITRFNMFEWTPPVGNVFLILDPPYIASDTTRYDGGGALAFLPILFDLTARYPFALFCDTRTREVFRRLDCLEISRPVKSLFMSARKTREETLLYRLP